MIKDEFEKPGSLVHTAFRAVQSSEPRKVTRVLVEPSVDEEEKKYALLRMRKAGWIARIEQGYLLLSDPPRKEKPVGS
jgi:hypothetical protein